MDTTPIISVNAFNPTLLYDIPYVEKPSGNASTRGKRPSYKDLICAFDIETTRLPDIEQSIMYVWQFQLDEYYTIIGRTWTEFAALLRSLRACMGEKSRLLCFVHNLSYEFQFLSGIFQFEQNNVFCMDSRKVLKAVLDPLELRCSYLLTNMSLDAFTRQMQVEHGKLSGAEFDYSVQRFPWTPLTAQELKYCQNDVLGLVEAIKKKMALENDTIYSIPMTSTGYIRRKCKAAMRQVSHSLVKDQLPDLHLFEMLREAFRGGNTHCCRYYSGHVLQNVNSVDRSSSYPDVMCNKKFPMSEFQQIPDATLEDVLRHIHVRQKAVLMRIALSGVRLANRAWPIPYISIDKCRDVLDPITANGGLDPEYIDNGRIIKAAYLEMTITDVDLRIILKEYSFDDIRIIEAWSARYAPLPSPLRKVITDLYKRKSELKPLSQAGGTDAIYYDLSKSEINASYGMMVQNPLKESIIYLESDPDLFVQKVMDPEAELAKHNAKAFTAYQWGCWVTAWARYELECLFDICEEQRPGSVIYTDTDSVKYFGEVDFTEYNAEKIKNSKEHDAWATDPEGAVYFMGVAEYEGQYTEFASLGAKKYVSRKAGEPLITTIAGVTKDRVNKKTKEYTVRGGGAELEAAGGIEAFKPGFIFHDAGGVELIYNDHPDLEPLEIDGHRLEITRNVVIRPSTYQLGITAEYERLLNWVKVFAGG